MSEVADHEFKREVVERLARIEKGQESIPTFINIVTSQTERLTRTEESCKSAHKRISDVEEHVAQTKKDIYWTGGLVVGGIQFVFWLLGQVGK